MGDARVNELTEKIKNNNSLRSTNAQHNLKLYL